MPSPASRTGTLGIAVAMRSRSGKPRQDGMLIGLTVPAAASMGPALADADRADRAVGHLARVGDHLIGRTPNMLCLRIFRRRLDGGMHQLTSRVDESDGDLGAADVEGQGT